MPGHVQLALSLLLPSTCARCLGPLPAASGSRAGVCAACWASIQPHPEPHCPRCGTPEVGEPGPCLRCRSTPPPWQAATCVGPYGGALRELILLFKSHGRDELSVPLAELALDAWRRSAWPSPEVVVPVPATVWRQLRRGFNQAELLSRVIAKRLGSCHRDALRRTGGGTQRGRSRQARLGMAASTFRARGRIAGTALLVDDVLTTGATAAACARLLLRAGAEEVRVLTLARTPAPGSLA